MNEKREITCVIMIKMCMNQGAPNDDTANMVRCFLFFSERSSLIGFGYGF
jgi:hypothetical protein